MSRQVTPDNRPGGFSVDIGIGGTFVYRLNRKKRKMLVAGWLLAIGGLWLTIGLQIAHDRDQARRGAMVNATNLSRTFEEHIISTVHQTDALLLQLREEYIIAPVSFGERVRFHQQQAYNGIIIQVSVTDADGIMVYNDRAMPGQPLDLSDREHVRVHAESDLDRLFISKPVLGRVSNRWSIQFTRRIVARDGSFAGVMILSLDPAYFSGFFRSVDVGPHGVITLLGLDRVIRVRSTDTGQGESAKGISIPGDRPMFDLQKPAAGVYSMASLVDGVTRIAAYRRLQEYPLVVRVAFAEDDIFGPVNTRALHLVVVGTLASVAMLVGLFLILALEDRQQLLHERLAENEEKFHTLADFTSDWEYWIDARHRFVYNSYSCLAITGYSAEDFMANPDLLGEIIHPLDRELLAGHLRTGSGEDAGYEARQDIEFRIVTKGGEVRWLSHSCRPIHGADGGDKGRRASNRDITERKRAEDALQQSKELLRTITDRVPGGLFLCRQSERGISLPWFNSHLVDLCGIDEPSLKADAGLIYRHMHPRDAGRVRRAMQEAAAEAAPFRAEWRYRQRSAGAYRWVRCDAVPRREADGSTVWYSYLADIQDTKLIEEQLRDALSEVKHLAATDPLTRLPNRRAFFDCAKAEFSRSRRYGRPLAAIMIDIDHFKRVNDTLGHAAGDAVLELCAAIIGQCVRDCDLIARYGGEEFVVLLPETDGAAAATIAERIRFEIESARWSLETDAPPTVITVSLGVALMEPDAALPVFDLLLQQADQALYRAKDQGRNRVAWYGGPL